MNFDVVVAAKANKPQQTYPVIVEFGLHTFTKGKPEQGAAYASDLEFTHEGETRLFCQRRYTLSAGLPEIMRGIGERKCYFTDHDPYFIVNGATLAGGPCEYAIFFKVSKSSKGGRLRVFVVSAYPIDEGGVPLKRTKQVKFSVIAYNTRNNRPIKAPR
ncbi:MAG: hypothetical protein ABL883_11965 [Terricaulis sp.]